MAFALPELLIIAVIDAVYEIEPYLEPLVWLRENVAIYAFPCPKGTSPYDSP